MGLFKIFFPNLASMIDTLLYRSFGKPFLIDFFQLLIGLTHTEGSGNLTSVYKLKCSFKIYTKTIFIIRFL
jgi:hypothetical protein